MKLLSLFSCKVVKIKHSFRQRKELEHPPQQSQASAYHGQHMWARVQKTGLNRQRSSL